MANELLGVKFDIYCPANNYEQQEEVVKHLAGQGLECKKFDGANYPSWAKIINECMELSQTDYFFYVSHKNRPNREHFIKSIALLKSGYAIAGMFDMTFHGINKDLIRKIGPYDERYLNGGWEEVDMFWRCCENNIAVYANQESYYSWEKSTWKYGGLSHYKKKWLEPEGDNYIHKIVEEEKYNYNFGEYKGTKFLPWTDSFIRGQEENKNKYRDWKVMKKNSFFL